MCNDLFLKVWHNLHSVVVYGFMFLIAGGETSVGIGSQGRFKGGVGNSNQRVGEKDARSRP